MLCPAKEQLATNAVHQSQRWGKHWLTALVSTCMCTQQHQVGASLFEGDCGARHWDEGHLPAGLVGRVSSTAAPRGPSGTREKGHFSGKKTKKKQANDAAQETLTQ